MRQPRPLPVPPARAVSGLPLTATERRAAAAAGSQPGRHVADPNAPRCHGRVLPACAPRHRRFPSCSRSVIHSGVSLPWPRAGSSGYFSWLDPWTRPVGKSGLPRVTQRARSSQRGDTSAVRRARLNAAIPSARRHRRAGRARRAARTAFAGCGHAPGARRRVAGPPSGSAHRARALAVWTASSWSPCSSRGTPWTTSPAGTTTSPRRFLTLVPVLRRPARGSDAERATSLGAPLRRSSSSPCGLAARSRADDCCSTTSDEDAAASPLTAAVAGWPGGHRAAPCFALWYWFTAVGVDDNPFPGSFRFCCRGRRWSTGSGWPSFCGRAGPRTFATAQQPELPQAARYRRSARRLTANSTRRRRFTTRTGCSSAPAPVQALVVRSGTAAKKDFAAGGRPAAGSARRFGQAQGAGAKTLADSSQAQVFGRAGASRTVFDPHLLDWAVPDAQAHRDTCEPPLQPSRST